MNVHELISTLLDSENLVDVALGRLLVRSSVKWYELTCLGPAAEVKYRIALVLALFGLRAPVDKVFEFPELEWDLGFEFS